MTTLDFEKPEFEVKVFFKVCKKMTVRAEDSISAHKAAYNEFLDSSPDEILKGSEIEEFFVETSIDGPEGGDVLHD